MLKVPLKDRFLALKDIPSFFKLVWHTSPWFTIASVFLLIIRSAIPVSILFIGELIIDQIMQLYDSTAGGSTNYVCD